MCPRLDDVVISNRRATPDYGIIIAAEAMHRMAGNREQALREGRALAEARGVDLWETDDQTHFVRIGSYRRHPDGDSSTISAVKEKP